MADNPGPDWTVEVADHIEAVVGAVRDKTAVPATKVARALVFGSVAGLLGSLALVLAVVGIFRLVNVYLPFSPLGRRVWASYLLIGAIFLLSGTLLWRRRTPRHNER